MTDLNSPELMTFQEVKNFWRVSTNTARKIIAEQGIIRHRIGSSQIIRYYREDVVAALKALEHQNNKTA